MNNNKIGIVGSGGAVGVSLQEKLKKHPVFNNFSVPASNLSKLQRSEWKQTISAFLESNDLIILALPDEIAKKVVAVKNQINSSTKIIDCSTAHRVSPEWSYGLPELPNQTDKIKQAELVANPGCHATAGILSIKPLIDEGLIIPNNFAVLTSITGHSGGGKNLIKQYEEDPAIPPLQYSTGIKHKHLAEITKYSGLNNPPVFQPEVVNTFKGLKTNFFAQTKENISDKKLIELFKEYYKNQIFINVAEIPSNGTVSMTESNDTQNVSIYPFAMGTSIQVVAVLNNLNKGAAGAAIQNANIMSDLPQTTGLTS
ncbi:MAG: hypothetical protein OEL89_03050 [Candidatus Peregrinibacteria bacterium]|nr:hypothetical protein [Candidatus Peregrinibacteria bacterium]